MATRVGDGNVVELGMEEDRAGGVLPAGRSAVNADARDVVPRILPVDRLMPQDAVGETGIGDVLPRVIVERLRAVARAHAIDLHQHEADFRQRNQVLAAPPGLGYE